MTTISDRYKYKIEKGIKIPGKRRGSKAFVLKYPFRLMKIGDSFLVPYTDKESGRVKYHMTHMRDRTNGFIFTVRKMDNGVRVWRIK